MRSLTRLSKREYNRQFTHPLTPSWEGVRGWVPNPGSQSHLFFDILGCEKGEEKVIDYGDGETETAYSVIPRPYLKEAKYILFRAGSRSGKSQCGAAYCYTMAQNYPNAVGLISANDYLQLRDSTITALITFCDRHNIPFEPRRATVEETAASVVSIKQCWIYGVHHLVRTAKDFLGNTKAATQKGRGFEIGWAWLDEWFRVPRKSAWEALVTRLSIPIEKPSMLLTSTINTDNPYNWVYDLFDDPDRPIEQQKAYISLTGSTYENRHNLAKGYIEGLKVSLTPELFKIEVLGEYTPITEGKIFKYFNRLDHCFPLNLDPNYSIYLSLDFNHDPMTAIAGQWIDGELLIIKEWFLRNSDSFQMGDTLAKWLAECELIVHRQAQVLPKIYLHGDATGNSKTANSKSSNWQIINDKLKQFKPSRIYGKTNPSVSDSINSLNCAFNSNRIGIDSNCKELTKDLESLQYNDKGEIDKKQDLLRSHLADCLRYLSWHLMPIVTSGTSYQSAKTIV
ncbi:MAG: terminase family protein [Crocosphaera sp.]|nr:terminase family protein [Crocosphaera sp.]